MGDFWVNQCVFSPSTLLLVLTILQCFLCNRVFCCVLFVTIFCSKIISFHYYYYYYYCCCCCCYCKWQELGTQLRSFQLSTLSLYFHNVNFEKVSSRSIRCWFYINSPFIFTWILKCELKFCITFTIMTRQVLKVTISSKQFLQMKHTLNCLIFQIVFGCKEQWHLWYRTEDKNTSFLAMKCNQIEDGGKIIGRFLSTIKLSLLHGTHPVYCFAYQKHWETPAHTHGQTLLHLDK